MLCNWGAVTAVQGVAVPEVDYYCAPLFIYYFFLGIGKTQLFVVAVFLNL